MMRKVQYIILTGCFLLAACAHKDDDEMRARAESLYQNSVKLLTLYTDSLAQAKDSATVNRLDKGLDDKLTHLNLEELPEAYLGIPEGRNDTISRMTLRFANMRDSLLNRLAHPVSVSDSVPRDSLPRESSAPAK